MSDISSLSSVLNSWSMDHDIQPNFVFSTRIEGSPPILNEFPENLSPILIEALQHSGISRLYSHQYLAWDHGSRKENLVIISGTASGKSLCYYLPVLDAMLRNPAARALFLFPTKALAQDQLNKVHSILQWIPNNNITVASYDGDTPSVNARPFVKKPTSLSPIRICFI